MSILCLNCWCARTFLNILENFFNKKFLELSLECTINSAGHSETFDFSGTLSNFYTFLRSTFELNWWNKCWQFLSTTILSELTTFPLSIVGEWVISVLNYFRIFGVVLCWSRERGLFKSSCLNFLAFLKLFRLT